MNLIFLEQAVLELEDGKEYYNLKQDKLGENFKQTVQECIDRILYNPELYPKLQDEIRRCIIHKFPYNIYYTHDKTKKTIVILSIAHQRRKPYYWIENK